jgi:hypothetical protein
MELKNSVNSYYFAVWGLYLIFNFADEVCIIFSTTLSTFDGIPHECGVKLIPGSSITPSFFATNSELCLMVAFSPC